MMFGVVPRPKDKSVVSSKLIFKTKHSVYGSIEKFKAIFVTQGFSQKEGIGYEKLSHHYQDILLPKLSLPWQPR